MTMWNKKQKMVQSERNAQKKKMRERERVLTASKGPVPVI